MAPAGHGAGPILPPGPLMKQIFRSRLRILYLRLAPTTPIGDTARLGCPVERLRRG